MGMFGRRKAPAYDKASIEPPGIGGRILNQIGMNVLGVDFEGMRLRDALARKRFEFEQGLAEQVAGTPDRLAEAQIQGGDGSDISAAFGPQMDFKPGRAPLDINNKQLPALIYQADRLGVPVTKLLDVLKAQQPDVRFDRGFGYNSKTGEAAGGFHPELGEGRGIVDGRVATLPGYRESVGEIEGTRTGAQEAAKAGWDMVEVKIGGSVVQLPRSVALPLITQAFAAQNGGQLPENFGRGESPAEASAAKIEADARAEAGLGLPQASAEAQGALDLIGKLKTHPGLGPRTGLTAVLPAIPGTPGADFDTMAEQLRGKVFQQAYQSLKGAGAITEQEGRAATAAIARLNQRQTQEGYVGALDELEGIIRAGVERQQRKAGVTPASAARWTPEAARAELDRRRRAAQGR